MTVKEVFELRKQGKIEEAYEAIRPMYAVHQGKYTTLCMFWTASDVMKKRIEEKRTDEAAKIFEALLRVLPHIEDRDGKARTAILNGALRLSEEMKTFSMLRFMEHHGNALLTDEDWKMPLPSPTPAGAAAGYPLPSIAQRLLTRCFHELQEHPDTDHALQVMPLLQETAKRNGRNKNTQRYMAVVYRIMGEREKAISIYRQLLTCHHDSYLYAELAELTDEPGPKAALLCRAIQNQRQEKFRTGYRLALARLLANRDKARATHELQKCIATRKALGYAITRDMTTLLQQLSGIKPTTDAEQLDFYQKMVAKFPI